METSTKTDVNIIQELLAIYAARKEACEKLSRTNNTNFKEKLTASGEQTDRFIKALMDELSLHGDAVSADVNRSNSYLSAWRQISPDIETMNDISLQQSFNRLEQYLSDYYKEINATRSAEPGSLDELLLQQEKELTR